MQRGHLNIYSRQVCCADTGKILTMSLDAMQRQQNENDGRGDDEILAEYAEIKGWRMGDDGMWRSPRK